MINRPKLLRNIAREAGLTTSDVMGIARDLGINFHKVLGDWLLDTDMETARRFADHVIAEQA